MFWNAKFFCFSRCRWGRYSRRRSGLPCVCSSDFPLESADLAAVDFAVHHNSARARDATYFRSKLLLLCRYGRPVASLQQSDSKPDGLDGSLAALGGCSKTLRIRPSSLLMIDGTTSRGRYREFPKSELAVAVPPRSFRHLAITDYKTSASRRSQELRRDRQDKAGGY